MFAHRLKGFTYVERILSALAWSSILVLAPPHFAVASAPAFSEADRVIFIGDSITHSGGYTAAVYDYYVTRFPKRSVAFMNAGISGDWTSDGIGRIDWDILARAPTVANIMFGTNDVGRWLYDPALVATPELLAQRQSMIATFNSNIDLLSSSIAGAGVRVNLVTTPPYDQTVQSTAPNAPGVDDALASIATSQHDLAQLRGFGFVDIHTPMAELTRQLQAKNPSFSLLGPDRVHPSELGHFIMGYYFLKAQGVTAQVATLAIDAASATVTQQDNAQVSDVVSDANGLRFSYTEFSLPYPVTSTYLTADSLLPVTTDLNNEVLRVTNLPVGDYSVVIDGNSLGTFKDSKLSVGVNIATTASSPAQIQALHVHELNWQRLGLENQLRDIALVEERLHVANVDMQDAAAIQAYLDAWIASMAGQSTQAYYQDEVNKYYLYKPQEAAIKVAIDDLVTRSHAAAQPVAHSVSISPTASASQFTHSGTYAMVLSASGVPSYKGPYQGVVTVDPNSMYVFKAFMRGSGQRLKLIAYDANWAVLASRVVTAGMDWVEFSTPSFNTGSTKRINVQIQDYGNVPGTAYIDDAFLGVAGGTNKLSNPGFENAVTSWNLMGSFAVMPFANTVPTNTHSGVWAMKMTASGKPTYTGPYQELANVDLNRSYVFRLFVRGDGQRGRLVVYDRNWLVIALQEFTTAAGWTQVATAPFNTGANSTIRVQIQDYGLVSGVSFMDDAFVGIDGGANRLQNSGFENGNAFWGVLGPFVILQSP